jgi:ubiquinone biosynthesis protein UbiJ
MPISEKRLAANRANAVKSHGPITARGKQNSARNSTRHGIIAKAVLLDGESRERFAALLNSFISDFQPATTAERLCVETMAVSHWRIVRLWAVESATINHETRRQAHAMTDENAPTRAMLAIQALSEGRHLDLISRFEHRYDCQYYRALEALTRIQQERNAGAARSHQSEENKEPIK